jgi:hypothetical protein
MSTSKFNKSAIVQYKGRTYADSAVYHAPYAPLITKKWEKVGIDGPANKRVYNIRLQEIRDWIEDQPIHMWKHYDIPKELIDKVSLKAWLGQNYIFTEEMEAWFQLRWS